MAYDGNPTWAVGVWADVWADGTWAGTPAGGEDATPGKVTEVILTTETILTV